MAKAIQPPILYYKILNAENFRFFFNSVKTPVNEMKKCCERARDLYARILQFYYCTLYIFMRQH